MDESAEEIEVMAVRMPMGDVLDLQLSAAASPVDTGKSGGVGSILRSPVTGLEGVGGTPAALDRISGVAAAALQVLQNMPEFARWHLELMLLQIESMDSVVETRDNLERLTQTAESLAATADSLPQTLRTEVETLLGESNESMQQLDATLVSAKAVTADIRATVDGANALMAGVQELTAATGEQEPSGDEVSRDIADYTRAAEEARALTAELRGLVDDLNDGKLDGVIAEVNNASTATIDQASERAAALIDRLTWRLVIVVGALFGGLVVYRLITWKMLPAAR
jgi:methyl-accepting chemotaxis protein